MKRYTLFVALLMSVSVALAQSDRSGAGTVKTIEVNGINPQDGSGNDDEVADTVVVVKPRTMTLYRVNVCSQLDRKGGRELVKNLQAEVDELFPELSGKTHTEYQSPYFRMWVGWFYSETEAKKVAADLKKSLRRYRKDITITKRRVIKQNKAKAKDDKAETNENQKETD